MTEPFWSDETTTLHLGDCRDILRSVPDGSVDAVVTDPPYSLAFMGMDFDSFRTRMAFQEWCEEWGRECLRVLKPGGHLVAFGAPRTYHRLACGLEDAGFEVRDSLHWFFGTGYPKGQDIAKSIDKRRDDRGRVLQVTAWLARARDAAGWTNRMLNDAFGHKGDRCSHWTTQGVAASVPSLAQWARLRELLGFDDGEIRPLVEELNGRKGELGEDWARREVTGQGTRVRRPSDVQVAALSEGAYDVTAPAAEEAQRWDGWNTSLKPGHEPVVLARKSTGFHSTVANVLMHGTGALNIGACRVQGAPRRAIENGIPLNPDVQYSGAVLEGTGRGTLGTSRATGTTDLGRWPPDVLLTHSAGCDDYACAEDCPVAALDAQSGTLTSGANPERRSSDKFRTTYGDFAGQRECSPARGADSGGASRFFPVTRWDLERDVPFLYAAKASARERPQLDDGTVHVTVKPVAVMKWLVKLVTPPGGLVLDLFAGTGTTGEACVIEGFPCLLIERDPKFAELARKRLSRPIQPGLFGGAA